MFDQMLEAYRDDFNSDHTPWDADPDNAAMVYEANREMDVEEFAAIMVAMGEWVEANPDIKFEVRHLDKRPNLWTFAMKYAEQYTGEFEFMLDLKRAVMLRGHLSKAQAKGALNCFRAQVLRTKKMREERQARGGEPTGSAPAPVSEARAIPNGTYSIVFSTSGEYVTLRLKDSFVDEHPDGAQVVEFLRGADNESDFAGFGFVFGREVKAWKRFADNDALLFAAQALLGSGEEALAEAQEAYALESSRCARCNRKLTVPASIHRGLGPECAKKS